MGQNIEYLNKIKKNNYETTFDFFFCLHIYTYIFSNDSKKKDLFSCYHFYWRKFKGTINNLWRK